jgi:carboxyl-terminal processing protease
VPILGLEDFIRQAREFEDRALWRQAADVYQRAQRYFPNETELRERRSRAERRWSISRRFCDASFTAVLLQLSDDDAAALYREVLTKIIEHYVEPVNVDRLVQLGRSSLLVALSDPVFLRASFGGATVNVSQLQSIIAARLSRRIGSPLEADREAVEIVRICRRSGLVHNAAVILEFVSGAVEGLDPYSTHLTRNHLNDLYAMIDGNFVGLGVEVRGGMDGLVIVNVLPNSPAEETGLKVSDHIIAIDRQSLQGMTGDEAADRLRGEPGSVVQLTVRASNGSVRVVSTARREVHVHSVSDATMVDRDHGIGYLRIHSFQRHTLDELVRAVESLLSDGMRKLVIDIRGNPGGLLDSAVRAADRFIDQGVIVSTRGRAWGQNWVHRATSNRAWSFPIVVLIDGESASASEIFAAAIQDHRRGVIVGTRTFGKGSVQSIFPLRTGATGLRLTTARYYAPTGRALEGTGVTPDLVVPRPTDALGEEQPIMRRPDIPEDAQLRVAVTHLGAD